MQRFQLRFWHPIAGLVVLYIIHSINQNLISSTSVNLLIEDLITLGCSICHLMLTYIIIRNIVRAIRARRSSGEAEDLERQREIEKKEIEMVRKSNEILLHLIQDEHLEEDR